MLNLIFLLSVLCCVVNGTPPNIVLIIADDMGHNDVGYHGSSQIRTPNIDALGYNGHILEEFYTCPTCTPSRAALTTGMYPIRTGFQGEPLSAGEPRAMPYDVPLLPEELKKLNYETHLVGKWHLGADYRNVTPTKRGFDDHYGYWNGYISYKSHLYTEFNGFCGFDMRDNLEPDFKSIGKYATDLFTDRAVKIIENHNNSKPMFLMYGHLAPHSGTQDGGVDVPDIKETYAKYGYIKNFERMKYAGAVDNMDESIGKIMKAMAKKDMLNNTIVIFFSDNGAQTFGKLHNDGSNWPHRGLKFTLFQGGVKTPSVIWSNLFKNKNVINRNLFHITDWMPTLIEAAGGDIKKMNFDGISHWKYFTTGKDGTSDSNRTVLLNIDERKQTGGVISSDARFKYMEGSFGGGIYDGYYGDDGLSEGTPKYDVNSIITSPTNAAIMQINSQKPLSENKILNIRTQMKVKQLNNPKEVMSCIPHCLFDLQSDPTETFNYSSIYPEITAQMQVSLNKYKSELVPQKNVPVDPRSNPKNFGGLWTTWLDYV